MVSKKIRIGVIGLGYLGKFHYQKYRKNKLVKLTSVVDSDVNNHSIVMEKDIGCLMALRLILISILIRIH